MKRGERERREERGSGEGREGEERGERERRDGEESMLTS